MLVKELKEFLTQIPDDTEIFFRAKRNLCGNIFLVECIIKSIYGFFGSPINCIILDNEDSTKDGDTLINKEYWIEKNS